MEQVSAHILERSSDAIVVIRLADRTVLGVNEAFFAVTGHPQHELVGRSVHELLVPLESSRGPRNVDALGELGALVDAPTGLWTRAGELRHGYLSALVVEAGGEPEAVCVIRDVRDPTAKERHLAARERFVRTIEAGGPRLEVVTRAIQALGESLRWEFGALWLRAPEAPGLRCVAVWRCRLTDLQALEEASQGMTAALGVGLVGRCWQDRQAAWVPDALQAPDPEPRRQAGTDGELVRGWFGFPVWAGGDPIGVVEFFSREVRQPDEELLDMTDEFGSLLGRFVEAPEAPSEPSNSTPAPGADASGEDAAGSVDSVSSALRSLGQAAVTVAGAMERQPDVQSTPRSPQMLRELAASIGKLDRLLEGSLEADRVDRPDQQPWEPGPGWSAEPRPRVPTGLTLKAVSRRTGIPAATLRTWERRYGFLRPTRSANGYRLYGEQEIEQVLAVKQLLEQGVRIGQAMAMVRGTTQPPRAAG